jgi:hypothetical protein
MEWAKTRSASRFNLATSGVLPVPFRELGATPDDLELSGPPGYGFEPLLRALAARCAVPEECVVAAVGTSQANHLAMAAMLSPGDEVAMEHPLYHPLPEVARQIGAEVRLFRRHESDGFGIDLDEVRRAVGPRTRLIVLTNLHNPTGARTDEATLAGIGAIARAAGARVLVDEVYLEMLWVEGERSAAGPRSAFHLGPEFIVTTSLTKAYGLGGLRCGWVLAQPELAEKMWRLLDLFVGGHAHLAERLSVVALRRIGALADRAKALLVTNRALLDRFLDARDDLDVARPGVGTVVFPRWRGGDVAPLCARLRERYETTVVPGAYFGVPDRFRLGIGGETAELAAGLERLGRALDE